MKCADPILCYLDHKGNRKFRHFSFAIKQILHIPKSHIVFDCGQCLTCRKKRAYELASRCVLHASLYEDNCFLTLTYDEKKEGYHNEFNYRDIQLFKKKLRKYVSKHHNKTVQIFNVHEYGKNGKKHWHLILFNHDFADKKLHTEKNQIKLYTSQTLTKLWTHGFTTLGDVSAASAMYTAQYCEKDFKNGNVLNAKKSKSIHSGLGKPYFMQHYKQILSLGYVPINGRKLPVPRYFQKLAKRHWAFFYEPSLFLDNAQRKAQFRHFKKSEQPNSEIAEFFKLFTSLRSEKIHDLEEAWTTTINTFLTTATDPDFIKSNQNALHDLKNLNLEEKF